MSNGRRKSKKPQKWEEFGSFTQETEPTVGNTVSVDEESIKPEPRKSDAEMSVLDVLQGFRQGFFANCSLCPLHLKSWQNTIDHINFHREVHRPTCATSGLGVPKVCIDCKKHKKLFAFHIHVEQATDKTFLCSYCMKSFKKFADLQEHLDVRCIQMKCPVCSITFDQEYKLYQHMSECLRDFHPHVKKLICHICSLVLDLENVADHMFSHSTCDTTTSDSQQVKKDSILLPTSAKNCFLCDVCDAQFSSYKNYEDHFSQHQETSKLCPLCHEKGFIRNSFIVRHLILRCPKRTQTQISFAQLLLDFGKPKRLFFLDTLRVFRHDQRLLYGIHIWSNVEMVQDYLKSFIAANEKELDSIVKRSHLKSSSFVAPPTDLDMLFWLTNYELANRDSEEGGSRIDLLTEKYPGIRILPEVSLDTLRSVNEEAKKELKKNWLEEGINSGVVNEEQFERLQMEAQMLRELEPFYFKDAPSTKLFSPLEQKAKKAKMNPDDLDPTLVEKLITEAKMFSKHRDSV